MRLLNTATYHLAGPFFGPDIPRYAILSHTWGQEELSLQDMSDVHRHQEKRGYRKIQSCCQRALKDAYSYIWVDTVCIDKTSSVELSEAINSMYKWYSKAEVCYAILEDLETVQTSDSFLSDLRDCRWFTRGWTLQELIAPRQVIFVNKNWVEVGDKESLTEIITEITGIDYLTLNGPLPIQQLSVANRMSWASRRKTTRPEDEAYCLLGIFGINMPLLYGEGGEKAFLRLQNEVLRKTEDQSIFAWSTEGVRNIETPTKHWGLLAPTPGVFKNSSQYIPVRYPQRSADLTITRWGIMLKVAINGDGNIIALKCRKKDTLGFFCVPVSRLRTGQDHYARLDYPFSEIVPEDIWKTFKHIEITVPTNVHNMDFILENLVNYMSFTTLPSEHLVADFYPMWGYDVDARTLRIEPFSNRWESGGTVFLFEHAERNSTGFLVCLFCNNEPEGSENPDHFVGVYDNPTRKSPHQFYYEDFAPWFFHNRHTVLANAATLVERNGISAWKLDDGTLVRVVVLGDYDLPSLDSLAVARILTGTVWGEVSD
jgi:hypothetical protein